MVFSMQDFLVYLAQRIWTILIAVLVCAVVGLGATYILVEPTYDVSFSFYIHNQAEKTNADTISVSDLTASQELLNTYVAILTSDSLLSEVVDELSQYSLSTAEIKHYIHAESVNDTELMRVTVTHTNPDVALDIAQSLQNQSPNFIVKVVKGGSVEVLDTATKATPTNRPIVKNAALGAAVGFMLIGVFFLAVFLLDTRIWDETDLINRFSIPMVGVIPGEYNSNANGQVDDYIISPNMSFSVSEAYRAARINIIKLPLPKDKCKILACTSAKPEEGKTISAINIAISLAQNNCRVLLIDMDFRKPQVRNYLHLRDNLGFLEFLMGKQQYVDIVQFEDMPLHVLATNASYPYPSEVMASPRVKEMFEKLAPNFDYIIVDTPPLEYVIDAAVLSDIVDGYILVTRAGFSRLGQVENTVKRLEQLEAPIRGFFLRNVDPKQAGIGSRYHIYNYADKYEPYYK